MLPWDRGESRVQIAPGAVHLRDWLTPEQQRTLVAECRSWARGPVPMRRTQLPGGGRMSVSTVCLGWHWSPYRYSRRAEDVNGAAVADFPVWLGEWARSAVGAAYAQPSEDLEYRPDAALINFYGADAAMGMHRDADEHCDAPVVSLSIGDACVFRFGTPHGRGKPHTDVELLSGDAVVFGGPSRWAYHGVPKVLSGTGDPDTGMRAGRLNITVRQTGLTSANAEP